MRLSSNPAQLTCFLDFMAITEKMAVVHIISKMSGLPQVWFALMMTYITTLILIIL